MQVLEKILEEIEGINYPADGIVYGLEDIGITDRYEAASYGWNEAVDRIAEIIRSYKQDVHGINEKNTGWIPVKERLPEPGVYLVTCDDKDYPVKRMRMKGICFYDHEGIYDGKVYAWMPLPEPYKENL